MRLSAAAWGFAAGIAIARLVRLRAPADALPSAMTKLGESGATPILQILIIVAFTFVGAAAGVFWSKRVQKGWSFHFTWIALASAPLSLLAGGGLLNVIVHALVAAAATALGTLRPRFSRTDVILIPAIMTLYFVALEIAPAAKPVTLFQLSIVVVVAARLMSGPIAARQRAVRLKVIALAIYPLFIAAYPLVVLGVATPLHLDFFEDGHQLLPASEMARGERPYADIVPVHGLLSDGGIEALLMKMGVTEAGDLLRARRIVSCANLVAIYLAGLAATGSMEAGFLGVVFALCAVPSGTIWVRSIGGILAVASAAAGIRTQRSRWMIAAGALVVVAGLFGLEFGVYSGVASIVAATRMRDRARAFRDLALGFGIAAIVAMIALAIAGSAGAFLRVTLTELLPAGRVYVPGPLKVPSFTSVPALLWIAALVTSAAMLMGKRSRRDGAWVIGVWMAVAAISYAQRQHEYFTFLLGPFVVAALLWLRRFNYAAFIAFAVAVGIAANPLQHVFGLVTPLRKSGPNFPDDVPIATPRGHGATVPAAIATGIDAAQRFVASQMKPGETWFDFANAPALYYLLDRDSPTRHHQVPFYETAKGQREVIDVLSRNQKVTAVLLAFPGGDTQIDAIPNSDRAPLVMEFIRTHFRPAFDENGVVFWIRR